ncbi:Pectinesterase A precursor [Vibrio aerogenes CECT 7868]|uniref:Pectinesterase A n=1 Tax=Vibrio aerogenes CECT 7868 TaxID=1216006 RepID=A0A1M5ZFL2_9VIBR|nr:pectinesterase family protein [Vibrio aerogenes]SHI22972.1 Pectinesterase A precursor [Vibrio aerogenes CECT 7868]
MKLKQHSIRIMMLASLSVPVTFTSVYASENSDLTTTSESICTDTTAYFCEDFSAGNTDNWNLLPENENAFVPDGQFDLVTDQDNTMLRYTAGSKGGVIALVKPEALSKLNSADYYVEAKIRPRKNSTTANKQLYLLGRYQDGNNWYAGALNVQNSTNSTQVEIAVMSEGKLSRVKRAKVPISQGTAGALDGDWHQLRFVMKDQTLTVYFDGDKIASTTDTQLSSQGLIGLWTSNKSFEIDDINVGNADEEPASLTIDSELLEYAADAGDEATTIPVSATTRDGEADTITVTSGDSTVVKAELLDGNIVLTPLSQGKVTVTITTGSGVSKSIHAVIAPAFEMPTATYSFTDQLAPAAQSYSVYEDTTLSVTFDSQPTKGIGSVRIYDADDDTLVDQINVDTDEDNIGYKQLRTIKTHSVRIVGNEVHITPHANALKQGKTYYVVIPEAALTGATLAGKTFAGIGRNSNWVFTTRTNKPDVNKTFLIVDDDGYQADFRSVQGAINFVRQYHDTETPMTILVKAGIYEEPIYVYGQKNLTIMGEGRQRTIITYKNNEQLNSGTNARALFLAKDVDLLTLQDLTLKNTTLIGEGHQAEALYFNSNEGRLIAYRSNFISEQDTLMLNGWTWFYKSMVAGNVDFIWGYTHASLFENSEIRTLGDSRGQNNGGYILQARVKDENDKGFVFLNSILTRADSENGYSVADDSVYLARSGGCPGCYDNIAFINTWMDDHIRKTGWLDKPAPTPETASSTAGWREFNSMNMLGYPLDTSQRLEGTYQMTWEDVLTDGYLTRQQIFADYNDGEGWFPYPPIPEYHWHGWMNWFDIIRL